jgi:glycosyltransferase involved in cell wall biosynthesis
MKHVIITPVYNEEKFLEQYIQSILGQTKQPESLILVDDSSTDQSASIIKKYSAEHNWIKYVKHPSESKKEQGVKVVKAFNHGLKDIILDEYDLLSKLDSDLELPANYFEKIINEFQLNEQVGIVGGIISENKGDGWKKIKHPSYHIRGALKSYRVKTFMEIGGLIPVLGWDGLDEMKAMYMGWETKNINVEIKHFRPASSDYNSSELSFYKGVCNYQNGANVLLTVIRTIYKFREKPLVISGVMFLYG